jgi:hypothetical protein
MSDENETPIKRSSDNTPLSLPTDDNTPVEKASRARPKWPGFGIVFVILALWLAGKFLMQEIVLSHQNIDPLKATHANILPYLLPPGPKAVINWRRNSTASSPSKMVGRYTLPARAF